MVQAIASNPFRDFRSSVTFSLACTHSLLDCFRTQLDRIGFRKTRSFEFGNWRVQKQETRTFELASAPSHGDVRVPWAQPGAAARQPEAPTSSSKVGDNSFATRRPVSSFEFRDVQYGLLTLCRKKQNTRGVVIKTGVDEQGDCFPPIATQIC